MDRNDGQQQRTTASPVCAAATVADLLDTVVAANRRVNGAPGGLVGARASRLRCNGWAAEPAAGSRARATLAGLEPGLLLAGVSLWAARRRNRDGSAAARADRRWSIRMSA